MLRSLSFDDLTNCDVHPQNITGITGRGKWVIPGLDSVLGSQKDDEFECSSEKRAARSSPFHHCNTQRENKWLFLHYLPGKAVDAFLFRLCCSSLFMVFLLWSQIICCLSTFGQVCWNLIIASGGGQHKRKKSGCVILASQLILTSATVSGKNF